MKTNQAPLMDYWWVAKFLGSRRGMGLKAREQLRRDIRQRIAGDQARGKGNNAWKRLERMQWANKRSTFSIDEVI